MLSKGNEVSLKQHLFNLSKKAGSIGFIYVSNYLTFNLKRGLISRQGIEALDAHIIARSIAELWTLPAPLLISQAPINVANLFGTFKSNNNAIIAANTNTASNFNVDALNLNNKTLFQQIGNIIRQSYTFSIMISLPVALSLILVRKPWIATFGGNENTSMLAGEYLLIYGAVVAPEYINNVSEGFLSAIDQEKWIVPVRIIASAVDIGLGFWLIPSNPLMGDAYATLARNITSLTLFTSLLLFHPTLKEFNILRLQRVSFQNMRKILIESWPYALYQLAQSGTSNVLSIFMGRLGPGRLAVYQIPNALCEIATSINFSLSEASNRIIAQYYGSNNFIQMKRAGNISIATNTLIYSFSVLGINLLQHQLASLFLSENDLEKFEGMLRYNFILLSFINLFRMLFDHGNRMLAATDDTLFSSFVWLISTLAFILPTSAIAAYLTNFDIYGISAAIGGGSFIFASLEMLYWHKRSNNIIATENNTRSSNQVLGDLVKKVGFFRCIEKSSAVLEDNKAEGIPLVDINSESSTSNYRTIEKSMSHTFS